MEQAPVLMALMIMQGLHVMTPQVFALAIVINIMGRVTLLPLYAALTA